MGGTGAFLLQAEHSLQTIGADISLPPSSLFPFPGCRCPSHGPSLQMTIFSVPKVRGQPPPSWETTSRTFWLWRPTRCGISSTRWTWLSPIALRRPQMLRIRSTFTYRRWGASLVWALYPGLPLAWSGYSTQGWGQRSEVESSLGTGKAPGSTRPRIGTWKTKPIICPPSLPWMRQGTLRLQISHHLQKSTISCAASWPSRQENKKRHKARHLFQSAARCQNEMGIHWYLEHKECTMQRISI